VDDATWLLFDLDLQFGERRLIVVWGKRRYRCLEQACPQRVFVERSDEIRFRRRTTERLRRKLATADAECRAYAQVAGESGVSWWLVTTSLCAPPPGCQPSRRRCGGSPRPAS
jgi:hypothetical protein